MAVTAPIHDEAESIAQPASTEENIEPLRPPGKVLRV